jgi:membrane-associated phospholipid phosphatase
VKGYYRTLFYIFAGMYICLIIYTIFPNAQGLRVEGIGDTLFEKLVSLFYSNDTCTNVCPSIHVYNSIMLHVSLLKNEYFKNNKLINYSSLILCILISLSTVFIKQHAAIDGVFSIILCIIIYKAEQFFSRYYPKDI